MDEAMKLWESMTKVDLFPDTQTYAGIIRGFSRDRSPADAMNIYEDMIKSLDPPEELPFRVLLKGLLPHQFLRNKFKKDFEELSLEKHACDPPEDMVLTIASRQIVQQSQKKIQDKAVRR